MTELYPKIRRTLVCKRILKLHEPGSNSSEIWRSVSNPGPLNWELVLCLMAVYLICYFSLWKGIKMSGKVVWFTAVFPYIVLLCLLVRGVTLPGAGTGIKYYLWPNVTKLADGGIWIDAATQVFFSLGPGFGVLMAYASYNPFHNNVYYDALLTSSINCGTSFLSGFVIFSVLGYMSCKSGKPIEKVAAEGPGLVFVVYPEAISTMPWSTMWSLLFFLMLLTLGLDSSIHSSKALESCVIRLYQTTISIQSGPPLFGTDFIYYGGGVPMYGFDRLNTFGGSEAIVTALSDEFVILKRNRELFLAALFSLYMLIGLLMCTQVNVSYYWITAVTAPSQMFIYRSSSIKSVTGDILEIFGVGSLIQMGGLLFVEFLSVYGASWGLVIAVLCEAVVVSWLYGLKRFVADIKEMLGFEPGYYWRFCWAVMGPAFMLYNLIYGFYSYRPLTIQSYTYPTWMEVIGFIMALSSAAAIPILGAYQFYTAHGTTFKQKLKSSLTPWKDTVEYSAVAKDEVNNYPKNTTTERL